VENKKSIGRLTLLSVQGGKCNLGNDIKKEGDCSRSNYQHTKTDWVGEPGERNSATSHDPMTSIQVKKHYQISLNEFVARGVAGYHITKKGAGVTRKASHKARFQNQGGEKTSVLDQNPAGE